MREEKDWTLTVNLARFLLGILILWFRADLVFAAGGGMALLFVDVSASRFRHVDPILSRVLARIVILAYLTFLISFFAGLRGISGVSDLNLAVLMGGVVALTVYNLMTLVTLFFPPFSRPAELPNWAQQLWGKLSWLALPTLLLLGVLPGLAVARGVDQRWDALVLLATGSHLALVSSIGFFALRGLPRGIADQSLLRPLQTIIRLLPIWFVIGSIIEVFRGLWLEWIISASVVAVTLLWVYRVAARGSAARTFVAGPAE